MKKKHKISKGVLLKGMSRKKLPRDILTDPIFEQKMEEILKQSAGIYALYDDEKLYYVGLARKLHGRVRGHLKDRHAGKWDSFRVFLVKKVPYLRDIETLVQNIANPKGNRQTGQATRDADLDRVLRGALREHGKHIKAFKKVLR